MSNNPSKIRSKEFILIYKNCLDLEILTEQIRAALNIKCDRDWLYLARIKKLRNEKTETILYCKLTFKPYMGLGKTQFEHKGSLLTPSVYAWGSDFLLKSVLTYCDSFDTTSVLTNFDEKTLLDNVVLLHSDCNSIPSPKLNVAKHKSDKLSMNSKQGDQYYKHYNSLLTNLKKTTVSADLILDCQRILGAMNNYRSLYKLTKDQSDTFLLARAKLNSVKAKLKRK